ncbi:MAG: alanine racemase, partial [Gemmatimonadetes bacterium]|nr:alanine racemase [Gemmatimonadota bacterium]NIR80903.1 alanine racemase [Gemmatimonadota bacterium]NIT89719.1 alanine racemase [Gemmatimonadota bacterium]NIU33506.1 alanine racemase [Gemmatimonadota bacterium]NIU37777.1 alanine racemase [Gemmatimonadota bacterium]
MSTDGGTRAWIEVRAAGLRRNLRTIRERIGPGPRMIPMVKADAYGLGVAGAVAALEPEDPWGYGVATVEEGRQLRTLGVTRPVLVFSPLPPGSYSAAVEDELTVCISDLEGLRRLQDAALRHGSTARFHLEVDTGMGRSGF